MALNSATVLTVRVLKNVLTDVYKFNIFGTHQERFVSSTRVNLFLSIV